MDTLFDADEYQPEPARVNPYIWRQRAMRGVLDLAAKSGSKDGKVDDVMVGRVRDAITFKHEAE